VIREATPTIMDRRRRPAAPVRAQKRPLTTQSGDPDRMRN